MATEFGLAKDKHSLIILVLFTLIVTICGPETLAVNATLFDEQQEASKQTIDTDIDYVNRLDRTALLEAIILFDGGSRHTEIVRLLVKEGENIYVASRTRDALPIAAGCTDICHSSLVPWMNVIILERLWIISRKLNAP